MEKFANKFDKTEVNFKPAKLHIAGLSAIRPGDFFIEYYYRPNIAAKFKRYRKTYDLNRIIDIDTRKAVAEAMIATINELLEEGIDPEDGGVADMTGSHMSTISAVNLAYNDIIQTLSKIRTLGTYKSHHKLLCEYLVAKTHDRKSVEFFSKRDAINYQKYLIDKGYSNKTVNTKIEFANNVFKQLVSTDILKVNVFSVVKPLTVLESMDTIFSVEEVKRIKEHLQIEMPELWLYAAFVYYCFMRPDSISSIKLKHIDFDKKILTVYPDDHKNSQPAYKQLLAPLFELLEPYRYHIDKEQYLFSKKLKMGNVKYPSTRAAEFWKRLVKLELKIDRDMYRLKDTGGVHYLENNPGTEAMKWLQMQMSHSDLSVTSIYTNKQKITLLDEGTAKILDF